MSAKPQEIFPEYFGFEKPAAESAFRSERRKRTRTRVHWPVLFFRSQPSEAVESVTQDLSSSGFYCLSRTSFAPGETLICTLKVPVHDPLAKERTLGLECKVRVMRSEPVAMEGFFGIACRIEDLSVARVQSVQ